MENFIYLVVLILISLYAYLLLNKRSIDKITVKTFGPEEKSQVRNSTVDGGFFAFYNLQIKRYSVQQAWSYALLWVSIFASLIMGGLLIYQNFITHDTDAKWLAEVIGLAGGGGVSLTSFKLYRSSSKKIDDILNKIHV